MEQMKLSLGVDQPAITKRKGLLAEIEEMKTKGQTATPEFAAKMRELENVLGVNQSSPFGEMDASTFELELNRMNLSGLQALASKHGIEPSLTADRLKGRLMKAFADWTANSLRDVMPAPSNGVVLDPNNPQHAKTIKILER